VAGSAAFPLHLVYAGAAPADIHQLQQQVKVLGQEWVKELECFGVGVTLEALCVGQARITGRIPGVGVAFRRP